MASHRKSIVINAPASEVFKYVNEPATLPEWLPGMVEVRNAIGAGEGQQYEWTFKMLGVLLRGQNIIVEYVANQRAAHQSIGMIQSIWTNIVEPHRDGATLTIEAEYTIPIPVMGKLAERITVRRNERDLESALLNVKEALEG